MDAGFQKFLVDFNLAKDFNKATLQGKLKTVKDYHELFVGKS